jgi:Flp pilus assembly protein TadD
MEMGVVLAEKGQVQDGIEHLRKAVEMAPAVADTHNALGWELAKTGQIDEGVEQLQMAVALSPTSAAYYSNLGHVLGLRGDSSRAVTALEKAVDLSQGKELHFLATLADAYSNAGRFAEAMQTASRALDLTLQTHDEKMEKRLQDDIEHYAIEKAKTTPQ